MTKDLLPLEPYERTDRAALWRSARVMAVLWGVPMTAYQLFVSNEWWDEPWPLLVFGISMTLVVGAASGLLFGMLWTWMFQGAMEKLTRRIHDGDPAIVPAPPEGQDFRLACSYLLTPTMAVGGHLYAAPDALTFVPHNRNLPRHRSPLALPAGPGLGLELVDVPLKGLARLLADGPVRRLRIHAGGASADFVTPDPDVVVDHLRRYYQSLPASPSPPNG